jgi:4-amino-4-deoxy-L-arabinose transferase-like glycosyltransferase
MTDTMLTLFTYLAVYGYLRLERGTLKWWYLVWASCAFSVMVKSAAGLIAPALITLLLLLDKGLPDGYRLRHLWQGVLLAVMIVAPWHIIMLIQHGRSFIDSYIGFHVIGRLTGVLEGHIGDRFYYVDKLRELFSPWFYLLPFAIALSVQEIVKGQVRSRILLLLTLLLLGLFTLVPTKIEWYILPICPALSILIASMAIKAVRSYESISFCGLVVGTLIVTLLTPFHLKLVFMVTILLVFACIATHKFTPQAIGVVIIALFVAVGMESLRSLYAPGASSEVKLARIAASTNPSDHDGLIAFWPGNIRPPSKLWRPVARTFDILPIREARPVPILAFYSNRPAREARTMEDLEQFTNDRRAKRVIMAKNDMNLLLNEYEVNILAEDGRYVYGMIKRRG